MEANKRSFEEVVAAESVADSEANPSTPGTAAKRSRIVRKSSCISTEIPSGAEDLALQVARRLPIAPKIPKRPFQLFSEGVTAKVKADMQKEGATGGGELAKRLGMKWKLLKTASRDQFLQQSQDDEARYQRDLEEYKATALFEKLRHAAARHLWGNEARQKLGKEPLTTADFHRQCLAEMKEEEKSAAASRKSEARKAKEIEGIATTLLKAGAGGESGGGAKPPAPPKAPYALFVKKYYQQEADKAKGDTKKASAAIARRWKALGAEEKAAIEKEANADKERYDKEMEEFKKDAAYLAIHEEAVAYHAVAQDARGKKEKPVHPLKWLRERKAARAKEAKAAKASLKYAVQAPKGSALKAALPKLPKGAFAMFVDEHKDEAKEAVDDPMKITQHLAAKWKETDHAPYEERAKTERAEFERQMQSFMETDNYRAFFTDYSEWRSGPQKDTPWRTYYSALAKKRAKEARVQAIAKARADRIASAAAAKAAARAEKVAQEVATKQAAVAAKAAAKAAAKGKTDAGPGGEDVKMPDLTPLTQDPLWDAAPKADELDPDDLMYNDKLVVAAACVGGEGGMKFLQHVQHEASSVYSMFRPRSEACKETALHYAFARGDMDMLKLLAQEARRGRSQAWVQNVAELAVGTTLYFVPMRAHQGAPTAIIAMDYLAAPQHDAEKAPHGKELRYGQSIVVLEVSDGFVRAADGWLSLQYTCTQPPMTGAEPAFGRLEPQGCVNRPRLNQGNVQLKPEGTGFASGRAYGSRRAKRLRKVNQGRGGREGNQAFVRDMAVPESYFGPTFDQALQSLGEFAAQKGIEAKRLMMCRALFSHQRNDTEGSQSLPEEFLADALRCGQRALALEITQWKNGNDLWGLNALHALALKQDPTEEDILEAGKRKQSILKKAQDNKDVMPIHCACANPDPRILEAMLEPLGNSAEDLTRDSEQRTLLHYAAACETDSGLEILLGRGFSAHRVDMNQFTPLMCACMANRHACAARLLKAGAEVLQRNNKELSCYHLAVAYDAADAVDALVQHQQEEAAKAPKPAAKGSKGKGKPAITWASAMTSSQKNPLHEACARGNERMVTMFLDSMPKMLNKADKQGRTPLIYAAMNGHAKLCSVLLGRGADPDQADTSSNTPLHYALGYGWRSVVKLLVNWGSSPDLANHWSNTPLDIALLKGMIGAAAWWASEYNIEPDAMQESGATLLTHTCENINRDPAWKKLLHALVEKRGADVNLADRRGELPVCHAVMACREMTTLQPEVMNAVKALCTARADVGLRAKEGRHKGQSALLLALKGKGRELLCLMLQSGAGVAAGGRGETLLHAVSERIITYNEQGKNNIHAIDQIKQLDSREEAEDQSILQVIYENVSAEALAEMMRTPDDKGLLPLHTAIICFNSVINTKQQQRYKALKNHFNNAEAHLDRVSQGNQLQVASWASVGAAGEVLIPDVYRPQLAEESLRRRLYMLVQWFLVHAKADLLVPVAPLEKPWTAVSGSGREAPGPMPTKDSDIIEKTVKAYDLDIWHAYDPLLGLATPLQLLVCSGDGPAVTGMLALLEKRQELEKALSAASMYGVTPLANAVVRASGPRALPPAVIKRLATPAAVAKRIFNGRNVLHLALADVNWSAGVDLPARNDEIASFIKAAADSVPTGGVSVDNTAVAGAAFKTLCQLKSGRRPDERVGMLVEVLQAAVSARCLDAEDGGGYTALHYAVTQSQAEAIGLEPLGSTEQNLVESLAAAQRRAVHGWAAERARCATDKKGGHGQAPGAFGGFGAGPGGFGAPSFGGIGMPDLARSGFGQPAAPAPAFGAPPVATDSVVEVTGVGRHIRWRFADNGVFVNGLKEGMPPGSPVQVGAQLVKIGEVWVLGMSKKDVQDNWSKHNGQSGPLSLNLSAASSPSPAAPAPSAGGAFGIGKAADGGHELKKRDFLYCNNSDAVMGLIPCQVASGVWYFELGDVVIADGADVGYAEASSKGAVQHWIKAADGRPWAEGCNVGVYVDVDAGEFRLAIDGAWSSPGMMKGVKINGPIFPVIKGVGVCALRLTAQSFKYNFNTIPQPARPLDQVLQRRPSTWRTVQALLAAGASTTKAAETKAGSPLLLAVGKEDAATVQCLCRAGAAPDSRSKKSSATPLHRALCRGDNGCQGNKVAVSLALMAARASVKAAIPFSSRGDLQVHLYGQRRKLPMLPVHVSSEWGPPVLLHMLLKAQADPNAQLEKRSLVEKLVLLPYPEAGDAAPVDSQEDRGLKLNTEICVKVEDAIPSLMKCGLLPEGGISRLQANCADAARHHHPECKTKVLRGTVSKILGAGNYEVSGGDLQKVMNRSVKPEFKRSQLFRMQQVESVEVHHVRPLHCGAIRNDTECITSLLTARADPSLPSGRYGCLPVHYATERLNSVAVNALIQAKTPLDVRGMDNSITPLGLAVRHAVKGQQPEIMKALLEAGASIDLPGCLADGKSALHVASAHRCIPVIDTLLGFKASPLVTDPELRTPLHEAVNAAAESEPSFDVERRLLDAKALVNARDRLGRTALHYAFAKVGKPLDSGFADPVETVTSLCASEGVEVDLADEFGATPILYAARRGATISSLYLAKRGASLHNQDVHGNDILGTALAGAHHEYAITLLSNNAGDVHASMRHVKLKPHANISEEGEAEGKMNGGESPLKKLRLELSEPTSLFYEAMKQQWLGLGYLLLDHGFPYHRAIQDSLELGAFRLVLTLLSKVNPSQNEMLHARDTAGRNLLHVLADYPKELDKEADDIAVVLHSRGVPAANLDTKKRAPLHCAVANGHLLLSTWLKSTGGEEACSSKSDDGQVPLQSACTRRWLTRHNEVRHQEFLNLLLAVNPSAVCKPFLDEAGAELERKGVKPGTDLGPQPALNVALVNVCEVNFLTSATNILEAKADVNAKDGRGETALCAALRIGSKQLVELLLRHKADPNLRRHKEETPLYVAVVRAPTGQVDMIVALVQAGARTADKPGPEETSLVVEALKRTSGSDIHLLNALLSFGASANEGFDQGGRPALVMAVDMQKDAVVATLLAAGAKADCATKSGRPALVAAIQLKSEKIACTLLAHKADPARGTNEHHQSPLLASVIWGSEAVVGALLAARADPNEAGRDKEGRAPLSIATLANRGLICEALLASGAQPGAKDKEGRSAVHHCIQPLPYGSFENKWLLAALVRAPGGKDALNAADKSGVTPLQLVAQQGSGRLAQALARAGVEVPARTAAVSHLLKEKPVRLDSEQMEADARLELDRIEAKAEVAKIPVHKCYGMAGDTRVWVGEGDKEMDALLFKVDLKRDEMRFYHVQLIHEANKNLFILFTRWGEIGETGQFQRTPQGNKDEALKEFNKVFKEKTGNAWVTNDDDFERKPNKYQLLKKRRAMVRTDKMLVPFHPVEKVPCSLPRKVRRTLDAICDPVAIGEAVNHLGINMQSMPFGSLSHTTLQTARGLLGEIKAANESLKNLRTKHISSDDPMAMAKQRNELREQVLELSSRYFELVPRKAGSHEVARPLDNDNALKDEFAALLDLMEASVGLRVLLSAQHNRSHRHPLEHCLQAMGVAMEELDEKSEEFKMVFGYAQRTGNGRSLRIADPSDFADYVDPKAQGNGHAKKPWRKPNRGGDTVTGIYRIEREGEAQRFLDAGCDKLPNRRLLWHGSRLSNLVGIFSQGLRVAPPEAPVQGYMFGKGIYFADMYSKSRAYCASGNNEPAYMVLCEVALGDMYPSRQAMYVEAAQPGTRSTWGVGGTTPGWAPPAPTPLVEPGGATVPLGSAEKVSGFDCGLSYNEFIVYDAAQVKMRYLVELNNFECPQEAYERLAEEKRKQEEAERAAEEAKKARKSAAV